MSVVPASVGALVVLFRNGLGVQVLDGPEAQWPQQEFVAVGLSPEDLMVPTTRVPRGPVSTTESADITCMIRSWTGDTQIAPRRARAYELLDNIEALLDSDMSLGGACGHSELTGSVYAPSQSSRGVVVDVVFVVRVTAF